MAKNPTWSLWGKIKRRFDVVDDIDDVTADLAAGTVTTDAVAGTPKIITPASSATANTYGSWTAYDASTSAASYISLVTVGCPARGKSIDAQIDIGVAETTVISIPFNYFYKSDVGYLPPIILPISPPIIVAAGTTIDVRITDNEANANTYRVGIAYHQK